MAVSPVVRRTLPGPLLLVALGAAAYLAWQLRVELIVLFASVLFGIALYIPARALASRSGLSHRFSVVLCYLVALVLATGFFLFAGRRLSSQYGELGSRIPSALETVESRLEGVPLLGTLAGQIEQVRRGLTEDGEQEAGETDAEQRRSEEQQVRIARLTFRTASGILVWAVLVFYIAFDGGTYARAVVRLVPPPHRAVGRELASALGSALPRWLVGRLASMGVVALLTAPGLLLLGVPLAFLLATLAGLFSFVPFLGPIAAAVPAVLVTLESAPDKLVPVLLLYVGVQLVETNVITPRIQQKVASVPPLLLISSQLLMGVLAGIVGVMFATPLVLAAMVTVQVLYVRHALGEEVTTPGED